MRRPSRLDIAWVVGALLLAAAYVVSLQRPSSLERMEREGRLLADYRRDAVRELTLEHLGRGGRLEIIREDNPTQSRWRIEGALEEPAAEERVDRWLQAWQSVRALRRVTPGDVDRKRMGLDEPSAVVGLQLGGLSYRVTLGGDAVGVTGSRYVQIAGDGISDPGVAIIAQPAVDELFPAKDHLRSPELVGTPLSELGALQWRRGAAGAELQQRKPGDWRLADGTLVDPKALQSLALGLSRLRAQPLVSPEEARLGMGEHPFELELTPLGGKESVSLRIGNPCAEHEGLLALREAPDPRAGCVPASTVLALSQDNEALWDRRLFRLSASEVERIAFQAPGARVELARFETGYRLVAPEVRQLIAASVDPWLDTLLALQGAVVDVPPPTVPDPDASVTLTLAGASDEPRTETARFAESPGSGSLYVQRMVDGAWLRLPLSARATLRPDPELLLPPRVFTGLLDRLDSLTVRRGAREQRLVRDADATFAPFGLPARVADPDAARRVAEALADLQAQRWVRREARGDQALAQPYARISFTLRGAPAESDELIIGQRMSRGRLARVGSRPEAFVISDEAVDALLAPVVRLDVFALSPREGSRLRLLAGGDPLSLTGHEGHWQAEAERAEAHESPGYDLLGQLAAVGLVHWGPAASHEGLRTPVLQAEFTGPEGGQVRWRVGARDLWQGQSIRYAQLDGVDAVFALPQGQIATLLDAVEASLPTGPRRR